MPQSLKDKIAEMEKEAAEKKAEKAALAAEKKAQKCVPPPSTFHRLVEADLDGARQGEGEEEGERGRRLG